MAEEKRQPGRQVGSYSNVDIGADTGEHGDKDKGKARTESSSSPSLYLGLPKRLGLLLSPGSHNKQMQNG